jgi:hypothetical protein
LRTIPCRGCGSPNGVSTRRRSSQSNQLVRPKFHCALLREATRQNSLPCWRVHHVRPPDRPEPSARRSGPHCYRHSALSKDSGAAEPRVSVPTPRCGIRCSCEGTEPSRDVAGGGSCRPWFRSRSPPVHVDGAWLSQDWQRDVTRRTLERFDDKSERVVSQSQRDAIAPYDVGGALCPLRLVESLPRRA